MEECFGIFEGGGAKGIAHVGALKAAEEMQVKFVGVGGSSAGAIVAALVAAGYTADELYGRPNAIFETVDWAEQFFGGRWPEFSARIGRITGALERGIGPGGIVRVWWNWRKLRRAFDSAQLGFFSTQPFRDWLHGVLARKVPHATFEGLRRAGRPVLKITASEVIRKRIKLFDDLEDGDTAVADAVAASISIPYLFQPTRVGDVLYVDGGLISNFPLWVFESELSTFDARPMLGFRFMDDWKLGTTLNLGNYSRLLAAAVFEGDMFLHARSTGNVHLVPLKTEVGTIDFDLDREAKQRAFEAGRDATREALWHIALRPAMAAALAGLAEWLAGRPGLALGRLRINVAVPESLGPLDGADGRGLILRLRFGHNMKGEPDYVLSFKPGVGGTGLCWQNNRAASQPSCVVFGRPQIEAIPDPMKRLVNADVKTLISVPVRQDQFLIGVCTFDCTADCQRELADPALQRDLIAEVSRRIAAVLARRPARMTPMVMPAVAAARLTPAAAAAPSPEQSTPHVS